MNPIHDQTIGTLAVELGLLNEADLAACLQACGGSSEQDLGDALVERHLLSPEDRSQLDRLAATRRARGPGEAAATRTGVASSSAGAGAAPVFLRPESHVAGTLSGVTPPLPPEPEKAGPAGGRFERQRLHGAGGIGRVWLGRDRLLERDVAIKELRPECASDPEQARRFLDEARITAQLQHPGVVPVYDLLPLPSRQEPYYVMRFVQGRTLSAAIAAYHARRRAGTARSLERVALLQAFVGVCNAVAFAHARGVLHRDLKGDNVVLGDFGEVLVLDWGLAKRLSARGELGAAEDAAAAPAPAGGPGQTLPGQVLGTPYYMAPEQAAGRADEVDCRADVYSLGALLYEILTGRPPFAAAGGGAGPPSVAEVLRRVREEAPPRPRRLAPDAPPALEAVCLRALCKDPAGRYATAAELRQEVQRWLADEPVAAYPEPWPARLARWARHNRVKVSALLAVLLMGLAGLSLTALLLNHERARTEEARARAEHNFRKAHEAVDRYLTQVGETRLLHEPQLQPLRRELLEAARPFYEDFVAQRRDDPASRRDLGQALVKLGRISAQLGQRARAREQFAEARDVFRRLADDFPGTPEYRHGLAQSYHALAVEALDVPGAGPAVEADLTAARDLWARLAAGPGGPAYRRDLANAYNSLAVYYERASHAAAPPQRPALLDQALAAQKRHLDMVRRLSEAEPANPDHRNDLAASYNNLAILYRDTGAEPAMRAALDRALELRRDLAAQDPRNPEYQANLAAAYNNIGVALTRQGAYDQAEAVVGQAVAVRERLAKGHPFVAEYQLRLAAAYQNLANLLYLAALDREGPARADRLTRGKAKYEKALEFYRALREDHPDDRRYRCAEATAVSSLGDLLLEIDPAAALPVYDQAIQSLEALLAAQPDDELRRSLANASWGRADIHTRAGRYAAAVTDWDRAASLYRGGQAEELEAKRAAARLRYIGELIQKGDPAAACAQADQLPADRLSPAQAAQAAQVLGLAVRTADLDKGPAWRSLADRAAAWFLRAHRSGYLGAHPDAPLIELYRSTPALADRDDVRQVLRELGARQ